ncbi:hypothetical protein Manayef4_09735 [Frankia sp. CgMI4]|nr:hypothetical protein Manayef4_09735 [Frankia sp. CgIM4]
MAGNQGSASAIRAAARDASIPLDRSTRRITSLVLSPPDVLPVDVGRAWSPAGLGLAPPADHGLPRSGIRGSG